MIQRESSPGPAPAPRSALALILALAACSGSTGPDIPPVASIRITPDLALLDLGGTVQLTATALSEAGDPIPEAELTWRSTSASATVDAAGLVTGVAAGVAGIEASSSDGITGRAEVRVSPVAAMTPDTGRYGAIVTLTGDDVLAAARVEFAGPAGDRVPAEVRSAGAGQLEVWVPVGAVSGPLRVAWGGSAAETVAEFQLTAESDVLAGGAAVPFPYHNPSLLGDAATPHAISFTLAQDGPFTLELLDRGSTDEPTTVRAWLFRTDADPSVLVSFLMTRDLVAGAVRDSVAYARARLPAGDYTVLVAPMDLEDPERTVTRPFGLRLEPAERFARPPDAQEPNDFPAEAPTVSLPFTDADVGGLGFETPYGMDHYTFELAEPTTVTAAIDAPDGLVLVYIVPALITDILAAWESEQVLAAAEIDDPDHTASAALPAGRYTALVWDWGAGERPYTLELTVAPPGGSSPVGPGDPGAAAGVLAASRAATTTLSPRALGARPPWRPTARHDVPRR